MPDRESEDYVADELAAVFDVVHEVRDEVAPDGDQATAEREALVRLVDTTHFARDLALQEEFPTPTQRLYVEVADDVDRIEKPPDPRPWSEYEPPAGPRAADADVEGDLPDGSTKTETETRLADGLDRVFDHLDDAREAVADRDWTTVDPDEVSEAVDRVERATHYARELALQREMADGPTPNQKLWATVADETVERPPRPGSWEDYEPPDERGDETPDREVDVGTDGRDDEGEEQTR